MKQHNTPAILRILQLRHLSIAVQFIAVEFVDFFHEMPDAGLLYSIIITESIIHLTFWSHYRKRSHTSEPHILGQLLFDVLALSMLILASGGAKNPFVSILILPVFFGAVALSLPLFIPLLISAVSSYTYMAFSMPNIGEPHLLHGHYFGMWVNFMLIIVSVSIVVKSLVFNLKEKEEAIASYREKQLQKEQIITLGSIATQMAHELATPLATLTFIYEELQEQPDDPELIKAMHEPLRKCQTQLETFRENARQVRAGTRQIIPLEEVVANLRAGTAFEFPDAQIQVGFESEQTKQQLVASDSTLVPALLNLMANAYRANKQNQRNQIDLHISNSGRKATFVIRDYGKGFNNKQLETLGKKLQYSETGLGIAAILSHATIERLGGNLFATNHVQGGALVSIELPIVESP